MNDSFSTPQEQLDLITALVRDSRTKLQANAFPYVVWGGMASLGTAISYLAAWAGLSRFIGVFWLVLAGVAAAAVFVYYARLSRINRRKREPATMAGRIYNALWIGIAAGGLGLWLISVLFRQTLSINLALAFLAVLLGLGYLVSAVITEYRALTALGWLWIVGGFACVAIPAPLCPAVFGVMTFCLEFIPGLVMRHHERSQSV